MFFELNGQPREVKVPDRKKTVTKVERPKADPANPRHVGAPMPGKVAAVNVSLGQQIEKGGKLLSIEAMKMENGGVQPARWEDLPSCTSNPTTWLPAAICWLEIE